MLLIAAYAAFLLDQGLKEKQALKNRIIELINEKGNIQVEFKEAKETQGLLEKEISGLKKSLQQKETEEAQLKAQIGEARVDAADSAEKLLKAKADIEEINKGLKLARDKIGSLEKINLRLNMSLKDLIERFKIAQESLKLSLQKSAIGDDEAILVSRLKLTQLLKAWDEKEKKFTGLQGQLKLSEDKVKELSQSNRQLSGQAKLVSSLENSLKLLGESLKQKENEIIALQARLGVLKDFKEAADKEKAAALKRKIEVILQNAQN